LKNVLQISIGRGQEEEHMKRNTVKMIALAFFVLALGAEFESI
jgi:hypothetical protein